jgi:hypothetical protein
MPSPDHRLPRRDDPDRTMPCSDFLVWERCVIFAGRPFDDKPPLACFFAQSTSGHRPVRVCERGCHLEPQRRVGAHLARRSLANVSLHDFSAFIISLIRAKISSHDGLPPNDCSSLWIISAFIDRPLRRAESSSRRRSPSGILVITGRSSLIFLVISPSSRAYISMCVVVSQ